MPVDIGLAQLSDHFLLSTVFLYALAMLAFAGDFAFGRVKPRQEPAAAPAATAQHQVAVPAGVAARDGAAAPGKAPTGSGGRPGTAPPGGGTGQAAASGGGTVAASRWRASGAPASRWVQAGIALMVIGVVSQLIGIFLRGSSEHRIPWGNMYEFITAFTCAAVLAFLVVLVRYRVYSLGLFVMAPIVIALGLCATVLYTAEGPLVPALHSYWIAIHVTAMIVAIGSYIVAAVMTVMYLVADRYVQRHGEGSQEGFGAVLARLPSREALDRMSYRTVVFAFPVWTFAVIAGAIWADQAWGRYWGWDPKETWSFITWVVYAGYLHARATAGWRGRKAGYIQLVGFVSLMFNLVGVNLWITGLHSYAGM
ncbi:MAG TPA: c-type cytochrome biogenesis protein CcsB [Streptosporangiaceae bacterium]